MRLALGMLVALMTLAVPDARAVSLPHTIHLWGDSISRGYALGTFADELSPTDPLYELRSISSMVTLVFADNGITDTIRYDGPLFFQDIVETEAIEQAWDNGTTRVGDVVVFEDAGPAPAPDVYQEQFWDLRAAAVERHAVTLLQMDMFDYPPAPPDSQYSLPLEGSDGVTRSRNDAMRTAVTTRMPYVGQTLLLPMHDIMDNAHSSALTIDGVNLVQPDGIHPNVWGQMLIAGEVLKAAGYRSQIHSIDTVKAIVRANWASLAYGGQNWTQARAEQYAEWLLQR